MLSYACVHLQIILSDTAVSFTDSLY